MHLLRAIPNAGKYLEYSIEGPYTQQWADGLFVESPYEVREGHVTVSDAPGWGIEGESGLPRRRRLRGERAE